VAFFQEGPGLRKWQWTDSGMKVINVTNILPDGSVDTKNTARFISMKEFQKKYSHFAIGDRDIVVASSGNTYGKVGRMSRSHLPIMMNTSVVRFHSADPRHLDDDYLYAFLRSHLFREQVEQFVIGSAQPNFGPSHLKRMWIVLPGLEVQQKIAAILSAYDGLIENNTRRIKILEEMAHSLYREWFVHLRFPGHGKVKMVSSALGQVPAGWSLRRIDEVLSLARHNIRPGDFPEEVFAHFSIPAYDEGKMPRMEPGANILSGKYEVPDGCVLLSKLNPRIPRVWMPTLGGTSRAIASTEFLALTPRLPMTPSYVYCLCSSPEFSDLYAAGALGTSTSHQRVKPGDFLSTLAVFPPEPLVRQFSDLVAPMLAATHTTRSKNANLRCTRDLLLPKLVSGEIDVSNLDIRM